MIALMSASLVDPAPAGINAQGLEKSFRTPHGTVHAVRGVDLAIAAGQTVALAVWTALLGVLAARAYRRDTRRA